MDNHTGWAFLIPFVLFAVILLVVMVAWTPSDSEPKAPSPDPLYDWAEEEDPQQGVGVEQRGRPPTCVRGDHARARHVRLSRRPDNPRTHYQGELTMNDATEAEVEAVARVLAQLEPGEDWPTNSVLGCDPTITVDDEYRSAMRDLARETIAALDAVRARSEAEIKAAVLATFVEYGDEAGRGIHSWRCAYPDRYGPCSCREEFAADVAARVAGGVPGRSEAEIKAEGAREALLDAADLVAPFSGIAMGMCPTRSEWSAWLRDRAARLAGTTDTEGSE